MSDGEDTTMTPPAADDTSAGDVTETPATPEMPTEGASEEHHEEAAV